MYGTCPLRVVMKLICSTFQPCRCIVSRRTLGRDTYWFSVFSGDLRRYWLVTSDMILYSRIQNTPTFVSVVVWTTIPSGLIRQNVSYPILVWPSWTRLTLLTWGCVPSLDLLLHSRLYPSWYSDIVRPRFLLKVHYKKWWRECEDQWRVWREKEPQKEKNNVFKTRNKLRYK